MRSSITSVLRMPLNQHKKPFINQAIRNRATLIVADSPLAFYVIMNNKNALLPAIMEIQIFVDEKQVAHQVCLLGLMYKIITTH